MKKKILYFLFVIFLIFFVFYLSFFQTELFNEKENVQLHDFDSPILYKVSRVIDGDTIEVIIGNKYERVRLLGINTPEVDSSYTKEECYGPEASAYLKKILENKYVSLKSDEQNDNRDKYNRLLRYVFMQDGTFVEEELIKNGYAYNYPYFPFEFMEQFSDWEKQAKENRIGLWSVCLSQ